MQVPRSSRLVTEDNDYALVTVVLFKRVVDEFKASARAKGYQVSTAVWSPGLTRGLGGWGWGWGCAYTRVVPQRRPSRCLFTPGGLLAF